MKLIARIIVPAVLATIAGLAVPTQNASARQQAPQQEGEGLKKQLGTIIVTPGNGPNLALPTSCPDREALKRRLEFSTMSFGRISSSLPSAAWLARA